MSREPLNPDLAGVEAALAALRPSPSALDRDRLMFLAGQAAGRRRARLAARMWAGTSAVATIAACVLAILLLQRAGPEGSRQTAATPAAAPEQGQSPLPQWAVAQPAPQKTAGGLDTEFRYLELRQLMLTRGIGALPEVVPNVAPQEQVPMPLPVHGRMLEKLLDG